MGIITELYVNKLNRIKSKWNTIKSYCTESRIRKSVLFPRFSELLGQFKSITVFFLYYFAEDERVS